MPNVVYITIHRAPKNIHQRQDSARCPRTRRESQIGEMLTEFTTVEALFSLFADFFFIATDNYNVQFDLSALDASRVVPNRSWSAAGKRHSCFYLQRAAGNELTFHLYGLLSKERICTAFTVNVYLFWVNLRSFVYPSIYSKIFCAEEIVQKKPVSVK